MASRKCPECGRDIFEQTNQCPGCGRPIAMVMCCPRCGSHHVSALAGVQRTLSMMMYKMFPEYTKKCAYRCDRCKYKF